MQHNSTTLDKARAAAQAAGLPTLRETSPGVFEIPSRTRPGITYITILLGERTAICTCPATGHCHHLDTARALSTWHPAPAPVAVAVPAQPVETEVQRKYRTAVADLYGVAA